MRVLLLSSLLLTVTACTWVPIEPAGKATRVLPAGPVPAGCISKGEVVVTVKSKVGFYNRNPLRVQEELETLARNEAPGLAADTVQPKGEPDDGEQRFLAFRCRGAVPAAGAQDRPAATDGAAETYPIED